VLGIVGGLVLAVALFTAFLVNDLRQVRTELNVARARLTGAVDDPGSLGTTEGRRAARAEVDAALGTIASARHRASRSPAFVVLRFVPTLSRQRAGTFTLIDDSARAATAGRELLAAVDALAQRDQLSDGVVPLDGLQELAGRVRQASTTVAGGVRSTSGLWGPLGDARRRYDETARSVSGRLGEAADALGAARTFLGAGGDRRYLVALLNNAEMRDQGAVLSYVDSRLAGGKLTFQKSGSVGDLTLTKPAPTPIPEGTAQVFGPLMPTLTWQSVNANADFAFSGRAMVDMHRQSTGQSIDGVIAIDVPGVAALLRATGPVVVEGVSEPISAENVGRLLLHDFYEGLSPQSDQAPRRERLGDVTRAVIDQLTKGNRDAVALGRELGTAAKGGHLRLYSTNADEESVFERTGLGGGPANSSPEDTFHLAVENRAGNKLDYYVKPSVRYDVQITPAGSAVVRTTVTLDNQSPPNPSPSYQFGPDKVTTSRPGEYLGWLLLWSPRGSTQPNAVPESGLVLGNHFMQILPGEKKQLTFETVVPNAVRDGRYRLRLYPQARLEPVPTEVSVKASGWKIEEPPLWTGLGDQVHTLTWTLRR